MCCITLVAQILLLNRGFEISPLDRSIRFCCLIAAHKVSPLDRGTKFCCLTAAFNVHRLIAAQSFAA